MKSCVVSFVDTEGIRHSVEVQAESLYEAVAMAMPVFRSHDCQPTLVGEISVDVITTIRHTVTLQKVQTWAGRSARSPKDLMLKEKVKELLAS